MRGVRVTLDHGAVTTSCCLHHRLSSCIFGPRNFVLLLLAIIGFIFFLLEVRRALKTSSFRNFGKPLICDTNTPIFPHTPNKYGFILSSSCALGDTNAVTFSSCNTDTVIIPLFSIDNRRRTLIDIRMHIK